MDEYTSEDLMSRAVSLLQDQYDPDNDSFFVVVTEGGKDETDFSGAQAIVGEINLKTVVAFIVQVVAQLCASMGQHPFVFIARHITAHFTDIERAQMNALSDVRMSGLSTESLDEPDESTSLIARTSTEDIEN